MSSPANQPKRKFAVFDIDGTIIRWQLYHAIVEELARIGAVPSASADIINAARTTWKSRPHSNSYREYELILVETYHATLQDIPVTVYDEAVATVFEQYKDQVYTYTRDLIKSLKEQVYLLFAISGSQDEIVAKLGAYYGFDATIGAHYARTPEGNIGNIISTPAEDGKGKHLKYLVEKFGATYAGSYGVGDSTSDAQLLELVENPIAFNPDKKLFNIAQTNGWKIVVERKNMTYELESRSGSYILA